TEAMPCPPTTTPFRPIIRARKRPPPKRPSRVRAGILNGGKMKHSTPPSDTPKRGRNTSTKPRRTSDHHQPARPDRASPLRRVLRGGGRCADVGDAGVRCGGGRELGAIRRRGSRRRPPAHR